MGKEEKRSWLQSISWRGYFRAIYCLTASHISINPMHLAGNWRGAGRRMVKKAKEEANKATGEMKHQRMWRSPTPSGHFQKDLRSFCHRSPGVTRHKRFQMTVNDNRTSSLIVVDNERISIRRQSGGVEVMEFVIGNKH